MKNATVIAEIGCNHKGDIRLAKEFINVAKDFCKVNTVKFQKRTPHEVLTPEEYNAPHPNPENSYGDTYGAHREFLEFSLEQHRELKQYCEELGMVYSTSIWDLTSAKEIVSLQPEFIKIPSALNTHFALLAYLCKHYKGLIHISLGMTAPQEERQLVEFLSQQKRLGDVILYACTSGYPVPPEEVCLLEIKRLVAAYGDQAHAIGFSGHHNGICIDVAAYTLGATYIERHYTLDRTWKGTDHAASLEPDGLRRLNRDLLNIKKALSYKSSGLLDIEIATRKKLKWDRHQISSEAIEKIAAPEKTIDFQNIKLFLVDVDGVLTDGGMYYAQTGEELKKFNTRDGQGLALLQEAGIKTGILTREQTEIVARRAEKLKVDFLFQGVSDKLSVVKQLLAEQNLAPDQVAYMGDDIHDLAVLHHVGLAATPNDAVRVCQIEADYISPLNGGAGCVRDLVDHLLSHRS